jgi:hypothetical protein
MTVHSNYYKLANTIDCAAKFSRAFIKAYLEMDDKESDVISVWPNDFSSPYLVKRKCLWDDYGQISSIELENCYSGDQCEITEAQYDSVVAKLNVNPLEIISAHEVNQMVDGYSFNSKEVTQEMLPNKEDQEVGFDKQFEEELTEIDDMLLKFCLEG